MTAEDRAHATPGLAGVTLREAELSDLVPLVALFRDFFAEDGIVVAPSTIRPNLERMLGDARARIVVAETEAGLLGMASGSLTYGVEFGCAAEVEDLYVVPGRRGRGLARLLMTRVLHWAEDAGASEIMLVITPDAEEAQGLTRFYEGFGFRVSQRITMSRSTGAPVARETAPATGGKSAS